MNNFNEYLDYQEEDFAKDLIPVQVIKRGEAQCHQITELPE
jgi:hypothetical protein